MLGHLVHLFVTGLIVGDLAYFLTAGLISASSGLAVVEHHKVLIKATLPFVPALIESFDIKEHMIFAPIAKDWTEYNAHDNHGELITSRL